MIVLYYQVFDEPLPPVVSAPGCTWYFGPSNSSYSVSMPCTSQATMGKDCVSMNI